MPLIPISRLVRFQTKSTHTILLLPLFLTVSLSRADLLDPLDFTSLGTFGFGDSTFNLPGQDFQYRAAWLGVHLMSHHLAYGITKIIQTEGFA
jgi:hypothetical protein